MLRQAISERRAKKGGKARAAAAHDEGFRVNP